MSVFSVDDLRVRFGGVQAVKGVSFDIDAGKTLAIVGESGSGKSASLLGATGLLPTSAAVEGSVLHRGRELLGLPDRELRRIRGAKIGFVFQDPLSNLHPLKTIGEQIGEAISVHRKVGRREKRERVLALLDDVGIADPQARLVEYPRHLSGGLRQRVMIAIAIALDPALIIADEPTTALDVTVQAAILDLLKRLQQEHGTALIFASHDLAVVSDIADDVVVMRDGVVVEKAPASEINLRPRQDYTRELLGAARLGGTKIYAVGRSWEVPRPLLAVQAISRSFGSRSVLDGVSFTIGEGEILGLVGESGSGKSTIGRLIAGLDRPDAGLISLRGVDYSRPGPGGGVLQGNRRRSIQMVFQDPYASLNPRRRIEAILSDPFVIHGAIGKAELREKVKQLVTDVELPHEILDRLPSQLSGGQRQRVAIARAIALRPSLIVADEPVSALDITTQAKVIALLSRLRDKLGVSFLFISHDLGVIGELCDRVIVLEKGHIVETGPTRQVFERPVHDYTRQLLASIPGRKRLPAYAELEDASHG
ncbi:ABC transporter ATP-binding protein [Agrobacterium rhizogenes]|nr:ABC transporter ATP-binding protein [Rhizobium rhizogenes]NTI98397.1 ABC transporter ATP-binding protein [Rhizobium rhizogenes]NTJ60825.1 ABC transporter ATP-binding protein [Rhizobium rhizogenes]OCJ28529.1 ABC transporter ATP-binding protein [Agrobacterium sp. B133/95]